MIFVKLCFFKLFNNNNVRKLSRELKKLSRDEKYYHIYMHVQCTRTYIRMETWADYELRIFRVNIYSFKYRIYF